MLYKTLSAAVYGIDASLIEVEVDVAPIKEEHDTFTTVGLPDTTVRESRERIRAALKNSGYDVPSTTTTINLAPADIRKEGSGFDLPMALGILGAYGGLNTSCLKTRCSWASYRWMAACAAFVERCLLPLPHARTTSASLSFPRSMRARPPWSMASMFTPSAR